MIPTETYITLVIVALYLIIVLGIGWLAARKLQASLDDLFSASKSLGIVALAMGVFGAQLTSFGMLGAPGEAYNLGFSSLGYMFGLGMFASAIGFYIIGYRAWLVAEHFGFFTPADFISKRFEGKWARVVSAAYQIFYELPYLVIQGIGGGIIFDMITDGVVPYWAGALIILLVSTLVAYYGGQRGSAWTNIFQGALMIVVLLGLMYYVYTALGGGEAIMNELDPKLFSLDGKGPQSLGMWIPFSVFATGLSNGVIAHVLIKNMSADSPKTFKRNIVIYPILVGGLAFLSITLGVWGSVGISGLTGSSVDNIVPLLAFEYAPVWMVGIIGAGIFAAIMSTWDGMLLVTSSLFTEDIIKPIWGTENISEEMDRKLSKYFILVFSVVVYGLTLMRPDTILAIAAFSFSGFASMVPAYFGMLWWEGTTEWGVISSMVIGSIYVITAAFNILPEWATLGWHYSGPGFLIAAVVFVLVSKLTESPDDEILERFFEPIRDLYPGSGTL